MPFQVKMQEARSQSQSEPNVAFSIRKSYVTGPLLNVNASPWLTAQISVPREWYACACLCGAIGVGCCSLYLGATCGMRYRAQKAAPPTRFQNGLLVR